MVATAILFIYIVAMYLVSLLISKKQSNISFIVGNRKNNWVMMAFSIAATWVWAPALFVSAENAYTFGIYGFLWFFIPNILTIILFIPFAVAIRERCPNGVSIVDYITQIYGAKTGAIYTNVLRGVGYLSTSVQLLAGATIITSSMNGDRVDFFLITLFMAGGTYLYSYGSGFNTSVLTDFIQMGSMLFISFLFLSITDYGTITFIGTLDDTTFKTVSLSFGISTAIGLLSGILGDQCFWQRAYALQKEDIKKSFCLGAFVFAIIPFTMGIIGFSAAGIMDSTFDMVNIIQSLFNNESIVQLYMIMVLSGLLSTIDSNLSAMASLSYNQDNEHGIKKARQHMVIMLFVSVIIANIPDITIFSLFIFYGAFRSVLLLNTIIVFTEIKLDEKYVSAGILSGLFIGIPIFIYGSIVSAWAIKLFANAVILLLPIAIPVFKVLYKKMELYKIVKS